MIDPKNIKIWVQVGMTAILAIFCLYLISSENSDSPKLKWSFGIVGLLIGYWLK
jgi:uncharacterized membrane protein